MKINTKQIALLGIFAALSVALMYLVRIPFPPLPFLEFDAGRIPIFICTFLYGPVYGMIIGSVTAIVQGLTVSAQSGWIGIVMNILAIFGFVLPAGLVFRKKTFKRLIISTGVSIVIATLFMIPLNMIFVPLFTPMAVKDIIGIIPLIVLYNVINITLNAILAVMLYKVLTAKIFNKLIS
ncbi:MAG: ECF transporter S component [Oscillospiraceae bacterium]|nr:ECF transporter S component [Oscillospiraceae bacterium]